MTQGDRLNQIKAKKQAASCGNVPVEKLKGHVRVKSVPSRTLVNNSNNNSGSGSAATTSAALSPSRPLTRMQAENVAGASDENQVCLILRLSRKMIRYISPKLRMSLNFIECVRVVSRVNRSPNP